MDRREKLTRRRRKTKQKHNTILLDTTIRKQTQIPLIRHEAVYKQLELKANRINNINDKFLQLDRGCLHALETGIKTIDYLHLLRK